jgi:hypothetical protein
LLASASPANAEPIPGHEVCYSDSILSGCVDFYLYWANRTARVTGTVYSGPYARGTHASFASYVGSTETNRQTRTAPGYYGQKGFNFTLGNPDVRGDLTQIKVWLCVDADIGSACTPIYPFSRP